MTSQTTLFGEEINFEKDAAKIQSELCCEACMNAKEDRCTCKCHGLFHGIRNQKVEGPRGFNGEQGEAPE